MGGDAIGLTVPASDQQRDWFARERVHRNPDLIISLRLAIAADPHPEVVRAAVVRLVERHGALRTTFAARGTDVVQIVHPDPPEGCFWQEDLRDLPEEERTQRYARLVSRERSVEFDLERAPLIRVGLVRMSATRAVISMTMHHIIADGWAVDLLVRELAALVDAETTGAPAELGPAMQCHEWSEAERTWAAGPAAARQLAHWQQALAKVRPVSVPPTRSSGPDDEFVHAEVRVTGDPSINDALDRASRTLRVTGAMVTYAAYLKLLATVTGRDDVATMLMVTGRTPPGYGTVVGSLTNVLTLPVEGAATGSAADLVPQVRANLMTAYANQRVFVSRVWEQSHLGPGDVDSLFIFDLPKEPATRFGPYDLLDTPDEGPRAFRRRGPWWENFKVRYLASPEAPSVMVEYNANRYDQDFARSFASDYLDTLGTF